MSDRDMDQARDPEESEYLRRRSAERQEEENRKKRDLRDMIAGAIVVMSVSNDGGRLLHASDDNREKIIDAAFGWAEAITKRIGSSPL